VVMIDTTARFRKSLYVHDRLVSLLHSSFCKDLTNNARVGDSSLLGGSNDCR
jgi:hypothetical protein